MKSVARNRHTSGTTRFPCPFRDSPWHRVTSVLVSRNDGDPSSLYKNCEGVGRFKKGGAEFPQARALGTAFPEENPMAQSRRFYDSESRPPRHDHAALSVSPPAFCNAGKP